MKTFHSSIEPLEARIAPAATIMVDLTGGNLTLTADANNTSLEITQNAPGVFKLFSAGNNFDFVDPALTDVMTQTFLKVAGNVTVNFASTDDTFTVRDAKLPKSLTVNSGNGLNILQLDNVAIGGNLTINGGANNDFLTLNGLRVTVGGNATLAFGDGTNSITGNVNTFKVGKDFTFTSGAGNDTINNLGIGTTEIKGKVTINTGPTGTANITLQPVNLSVGGDASITTGAGVDFISVSTAVAKFGKALAIDVRGERNTIQFLTTEALTIGGALTVAQGTNPSMTKSTTTFSGGGKLKIGKDVTIVNADGYFDTTVRAAVTEIGGAVQVTQGSHDDNATNFLSFAGDTRFTTKGTFTVANGPGLHALSVLGGNLLSLGGTTTITHGNHTMGQNTVLLTSNFITEIKGTLALSSGSGDSSSSVEGLEKLTIGGSMTVANTTGADVFLMKGERTTIKGAATIATGPGNSAATITARALFTIGGDLIFFPGTGDNAFFTASVGGGSIGGKLSLNSQAQMSTQFNVISSGTPLAIKKELNLNPAGAAGGVISYLQGLAITGATDIKGGAEADDVQIEDVTFGGTFNVALGNGADHVLIEKNDTLARRTTTFADNVTIDLGAGDNGVLSIGNAAVIGTQAIFKKLATFDGGAGMNDTNNLAANTIFLLAGQPVLSGF